MNHPNRTSSPPDPRPVVHVKHHSYQPSKAELDEPIRIDATPDELAAALVTPAHIIKDRD